MSEVSYHKSPRTTGIAIGSLTLGLLVVLGIGSPANASVVPTVPLGTADSYEVLAGSTVTSTGNTIINNGDVGLSPGSSITGFPPAVINNGVIHNTDAQAQQAQADLTTAYLNAEGRTPDAPIVGDLGGQTFAPGVYNGGAVALTGTVTLNGAANSVWIFQASSTLITATNSAVAFTGGAGPCNVFWQVGTSATIGAGSTFAGTVMSLSSISVDAGAVIDGRLLARNQAVTAITTTLNRPADCATRSAIIASTPTAAQTAAAQAAAAQAAAAQAAATARVAAAAGRLAETGVDPTPGLATAAALFVLGAVLLVTSRSRRRAARGPNRGFRRSSPLP